MDRVTEDTRFLIHGLKTLGLTVEDTVAILTILGSPENDRRMIDRMCKLGREPSLEDLLTMAELVRKY